MYKVIGLSVSCAQRPAPVRTRCTTRLNPENNRCVRNVPVPSSIDRFIAEAQYHSLSRSAIFAAAAAERARNNFNGGGIFTTSGGRNFANEMRDYPGIIVIRRSLARSAPRVRMRKQLVGPTERADSNLRWRSLMLDHPARHTFTTAPAPLRHRLVFILLDLGGGENFLTSLSVPSLLPSLPSVPVRSRPPCRSGSLGAHKLPQRVRAEPGRQTYLRAF